MDNINKLFDPRTDQEVVQIGEAAVRQGIAIGLSLGETINSWIDNVFELFKD